MTKLLFTGSRNCNAHLAAYARRVVARAHDLGWTIIVGDAAGIDSVVVAECEKLRVPATVHGWYGRIRLKTTMPTVAHEYGYIQRDEEMASQCDVCIAIWDGHSRGTKATYDFASEMQKEAHLKVFLPLSTQ